MKTPIKIIHNTTNKTWHPILYRESPLPGNPESLLRFKSIGHHTTGFKSREEAINEIHSESFLDRVKQVSEGPLYLIDDDIIWNGNDIPADTIIIQERK